MNLLAIAKEEATYANDAKVTIEATGQTIQTTKANMEWLLANSPGFVTSIVGSFVTAYAGATTSIKDAHITAFGTANTDVANDFKTKMGAVFKDVDTEGLNTVIGAIAGMGTIFNELKTAAENLKTPVQNLIDPITKILPAFQTLLDILNKLPGVGEAVPHQGGFQGLVTRPTRMTVAESGPEYLSVYPAYMPQSRMVSSPQGNGGGNTEIRVYLDGKEISGHMEVYQGQNLYIQRRR